MLDDDGRLVAGVPGNAVRRLGTRMIELEIDEARGRGAAERLRRRGIEVIRLESVVLPLKEETAVR
jgi:hypothetical protein